MIRIFKDAYNNMINTLHVAEKSANREVGT